MNTRIIPNGDPAMFVPAGAGETKPERNYTQLEMALRIIEQTILDLTDDSRSAPFLRVYCTHGGWVAHIADPDDPEVPYYGQGPYMTVEATLIQLALFIEEA